MFYRPPADTARASAAGVPRIPIGVLGDSDSHSYRDRILGGRGPGDPHFESTFQWPEVLARLRGDQLDPGPWGVWGTRRRLVVLLDALGLGSLGRAPRKEDYRYNLAWGGARCEDLNLGTYRQAPRLVSLMDREPERWRDGVVVIRIGIVSFGLADTLEPMSKEPQSPEVQARLRGCVQQIEASLRLIRASHPQTRVVLVGILDNADYPPYFDRWRSPEALRNIASGLDAFDDALRRIAAGDPRTAFFDDRAWFAARWGRRGADGLPAHRNLRLADDLEIVHAPGNHPRHSILADGHAGTAWNAQWAQSLVALLHSAFALPIAPITDAEVVGFVRQHWPAPP